MNVKLLFFVTLFAYCALKPAKSISADQLEKLAKGLRKSCLQKIDTTEALVEGIRTGQFPDDYNLKCYTNCIMKTIRSFRNGAVDVDMILKQVDMSIPPEIAPRVKLAINACRNEYTGDPCEMSYAYVKCYYEADPETFMFP